MCEQYTNLYSGQSFEISNQQDLSTFINRNVGIWFSTSRRVGRKYAILNRNNNHAFINRISLNISDLRVKELRNHPVHENLSDEEFTNQLKQDAQDFDAIKVPEHTEGDGDYSYIIINDNIQIQNFENFTVYDENGYEQPINQHF